MDDVFVSQSGVALTDSDKLKIESMIENYSNDTDSLTSIIGYPNLDTTDEEDVPSGMLAVHPIDAPVHADSIPEKSFSFLVVCPIKQTKNFQDSDFPINAKFNEAIVQYSEKPPSLRNKNIENQDMNT